MKFIKLIPVILSLLIVDNVCADPVSGAAQTRVLSAMYLEMKAQYAVVMDQLEQAKKSSDLLNDVKNTSKDLVDEYKFIKGFSLDAEINAIKSDVLGLTYLDSYNSNMTSMQKIELMNAELDKRVQANELTTFESEDLKGKYAKLIYLEELENKKLSEASQASNGAMNSKNLATSNASSNAMIAASRVGEDRRRLEAEIKEKEERAGAMNAYQKFFSDEE